MGKSSGEAPARTTTRAEPLLLPVRYDSPQYVEANRLLSVLYWFRPALAAPMPDNSILQEFISPDGACSPNSSGLP